jgi:hypothetical protein
MSSRGLVNQASQARGFDKPQLFDTLGRARFHFADQSTITLGTLIAHDRMHVATPTDGGMLENDTSTHRYLWSALERQWAQLSSRTMMSYTSIDTSRFGVLNRIPSSSGQLNDDRKFSSAQLRQEWTLTQNDRTEFRWGAAARYEQAHFDYDRNTHFPADIAAFFNREADFSSAIETTVSLSEYELYAGFNRKLSRWLTLDAGVHGSEVRYSTHQSSTAWDPRMGLLLDVSPITRLRLSAGRMTQTWAAGDLPIEQGRLLFDEQSTSSLQVFAFEHDFGHGLSLRTELFNKHVKNPRPRVENFILPNAVLPELRPDEIIIRPDSSHMKGLDLYATAIFTPNVSSWLSYSRSLARDLVNGEYVVRAWDQPHSGGIGMAWHRRWWLVSAEVFAHSNWPVTPVAVVPFRSPADPSSLTGEDVGARNSQRQGHYMTLNLKTEINRSFDSGSLRLALELANATDRINSCCSELIFFRYGNLYDRQESQYWLRVVPYASISWEF